MHNAEHITTRQIVSNDRFSVDLEVCYIEDEVVNFVHCDVFDKSKNTLKEIKLFADDLVNFLDETENTPCIFAAVNKDNTGAIKLAKMIGMEEVKEEDGAVLLCKRADNG